MLLDYIDLSILSILSICLSVYLVVLYRAVIPVLFSYLSVWIIFVLSGVDYRLIYPTSSVKKIDDEMIILKD